MAKVSVETIPPQPVAPVVTVTLEMSKPEALALGAVLANVGGDPARSPRRLIDGIYWALNDAGLTFFPTSQMFRDKCKSLVFCDYVDIEERFRSSILGE